METELKEFLRQNAENKHLLREIEYRMSKLEELYRYMWAERNRSTHPISNVKKISKRSSDIRNDLLGRLTTLLIRSEFFPTNEELVEFAHKHLEIRVPNWRKRSRREIIGVIVEEVYALPARKIEQFYEAASKIQEQANEGKQIGDFFDTWQNTIKSLKL